MANFLIIPGLGNSGPEHWQTYFQNSSPQFSRIEQEEWDAPVCADWISTMEKQISRYNYSTVILIGHSLGCSAIVHWAHQYQHRIRGAMLVAPSDPEADIYTFPATGFAPLPQEKLSFPSFVVASTNDIWVTAARAQYFADNWGSRFISLGEAGHINVAAGYGEWKEGVEILKKFENETMK